MTVAVRWRTLTRHLCLSVFSSVLHYMSLDFNFRDASPQLERSSFMSGRLVRRSVMVTTASSALILTKYSQRVSSRCYLANGSASGHGGASVWSYYFKFSEVVL